MARVTVTMDIKKRLLFLAIFLFFGCTNQAYEKELENCITAITTILLSHNHDVTALYKNSATKKLLPRIS